MGATLIQILSTGRTGTKFIASLFKNLGYKAHHEDLGMGGYDSDAVMKALNGLGDLWLEDGEKYFACKTEFFQPYCDSVAQSLKTLKSSLLQGFVLKSKDVIIDCNNGISLGAPFIYRGMLERGVRQKFVILLRNPFKTIHAIYTVEGGGKFCWRPPSFLAAGRMESAANIWKLTYELFSDQMEHFGKDKFIVLRLEDFTASSEYAKKIFEFLGFEFDGKDFLKFCRKVEDKPHRASKKEDERNSDLFHDREFSFSPQEVEAIKNIISPVATDIYGLDLEESASQYLEFHQKQKVSLRFK